MKKLKNKAGMTLAEVLLVVAIIGILGGVSSVSVVGHQRSLGQLERDGIAKELFVAAQNHLTAAYGAGYFGATDFGTKGNAEEDEGKEIYYFAVNGVISGDSVLEQMLPFGAIDETVRTGGSYIIRYQKDAGLVLDVFYCTRSGSPTQYNHWLVSGINGSEYKEVLELRGAQKKMQRRNWNNHILGWYGGVDAAALMSEASATTLQPPTIEVVNAEKLYVKITDPNSDAGSASLKLIVTGVTSGAKKAYALESSLELLGPNRVKAYDDNTRFTVMLDDITTAGLRFSQIVADTAEQFIPGEDLEIQAVAYSESVLTNIAYSQKKTANSLFGGIDDARETAYIGNIRHLENLDRTISNLDGNDEGNKLDIKAAEQTKNFSWVDFQKNIRILETGSESGYGSVAVTDIAGTRAIAGEGPYLPIQPDYVMSYDGKNHSISDVRTTAAYAGLFGATTTVTGVSNLELIDFNVTGTTSAGALAGTFARDPLRVLLDSTVSNVLVRNSSDATAVNVTAPTAGGLIGSVGYGAVVKYSGAAVIVRGSTNAGGLVGEAGGTVVGCFSGGHTKDGDYGEWVESRGYDVSGGTVGGLIGSSTAAIIDSYSTCSASGSIAGGLAGSANGKVENCYATGLVNGTSRQYAFIASGSPVLDGENHYYMAVNEIPDEGGKPGDTVPMPPVYGVEITADGIKPLDLNAAEYNSFTGYFEYWHDARAFDADLVRYYDGRYPLQSVQELSKTPLSGYTGWNELYVNTHYGDWPSPEVFFIND